VKKFSLAIPALALALGLAFVSCDNGTTSGEEREPVIYSGSSGGATYTLKISPPGSLAARAGDDYELTITQSGAAKISSGTVKNVNQNAFTLQPAVADSPSFTVTTGDAGITGISGDITLNDGTTAGAPDTVTGGYTTASIQGAYFITPSGGYFGEGIGINGSTYFIAMYGHWVESGTLTVSGATATGTVASAHSYKGDTTGRSRGATWTFTIIDPNTIEMNGKRYPKESSVNIAGIQGTYTSTYTTDRGSGTLSLTISGINFSWAFEGRIMTTGKFFVRGSRLLCCVETVQNHTWPGGSATTNHIVTDIQTFRIDDSSTLYDGNTYKK
jgi:hypothetical protein